MIKSLPLYISLALFASIGTACSQSSAAFPFCEDNLCGLTDRNGDIVLELQYNYVEQLSEDYFTATTDDGKQLITKDGTKIEIGPFSYIKRFSPDVFMVKTAVGAYLTDNDFKRISPDTNYDMINPFEDGYALVTNGRFGGVMNSKGALVLPVEYPYLRLVGQGKAVGQAEREPALFDLTSGEYRDGPQFSKMGDFSDDRASFQGTDGRFGYVDLKGDIVIPAQYDSNLSFKNGNAIVRRDREYSVIDKSGASLFGGEYYGHVSRHGDDLFQVMPFRINPRGVPRDGDFLIGLVDTSGKIIVDHKWRSTTYPEGNVFGAYVAESKGWALFDLHGNQISEAKYEDLRLLSEELAWTSEDEKYFVINLKTGEMVSPRKYDRKKVDSKDYASVELNGLYGLVGPDGREIYPPIFESRPYGGGNEFGYTTLTLGVGKLRSVLKDGTPIGFSFDEIKAD